MPWRITSWPAAKGIRCVNPSSATVSPGRTSPATASCRLRSSLISAAAIIAQAVRLSIDTCRPPARNLASREPLTSLPAGPARGRRRRPAADRRPGFHAVAGPRPGGDPRLPRRRLAALGRGRRAPRRAVARVGAALPAHAVGARLRHRQRRPLRADAGDPHARPGLPVVDERRPRGPAGPRARVRRAARVLVGRGPRRRGDRLRGARGRPPHPGDQPRGGQPAAGGVHVDGPGAARGGRRRRSGALPQAGEAAALHRPHDHRQGGAGRRARGGAGAGLRDRRSGAGAGAALVRGADRPARRHRGRRAQRRRARRTRRRGDAAARGRPAAAAGGRRDRRRARHPARAGRARRPGMPS